MELICFLSIFTEYFYLESEAENEINLKNFLMNTTQNTRMCASK
jgi:hypothetical protein